jgi:hypothetical protein
MLATLTRRVGRVEARTEAVRRVPATKCPWEWSSRLAEWDPRYHALVDWALPLAADIAPSYPRAESPRLRADFLNTILMQHSRLIPFRHNLDQWHLTQAEITSMDMFVELGAMGNGYVAETGDYSPCPLPWRDPNGWPNRRASGRRTRR